MVNLSKQKNNNNIKWDIDGWLGLIAKARQHNSTKLISLEIFQTAMMIFKEFLLTHGISPWRGQLPVCTDNSRTSAKRTVQPRLVAWFRIHHSFFYIWKLSILKKTFKKLRDWKHFFFFFWRICWVPWKNLQFPHIVFCHICNTRDQTWVLGLSCVPSMETYGSPKKKKKKQ